MKRFINNYIFLFFVLMVCKFTFRISYTDFVEIKYLLPNRTLYILICILINYVYLKISFQCIEQYLEISILSLIRISRKKFNELLLKRSCLFIMIFSFLSILIDYILYNQVSIGELIITIIIEIFTSIFMILAHKKIENNILTVTLLLSLFIKSILKICFFMP